MTTSDYATTLARTTDKGKQSAFRSDATSILTSNGVAIAASFVSGIVLARTLGAEGRGALAAVLVVPNLLISLAEMGVRQATVYSLGQSDQPQRWVSAVVSLLWASCVLGIVLAVASYAILGTDGIPFSALAIATGVLLPSRLVSSYMGGVLLGIQQVRSFSRIRRLPDIVRLATLAMLAAVGLLGVAGAVGAAALGTVAVALYSLRRVTAAYSLSWAFDREAVFRILRLGWTYSLALFLLQLNYRVDVLLLKKLSSAAELGQYSLAVGLTEQLWQLPSALGLVLFARSSSSKDGHQVALTGRLLRIVLIVTSLGAVVLALGAHVVVPALYGAEFEASVRLIYAVLPGIVAFSAVKILNSDLAGRGLPMVAIRIMGPAVVLNILLNTAMIPLWGALGSAIASVVSYTCAAVAFILVYCSLSRVSLRSLLTPQRGDFGFVSVMRDRVRGVVGKARAGGRGS